MWRLRSLQGRLVAGMLVVTALGLLVAGFATYQALAGFLQSRIDQQLRERSWPLWPPWAGGWCAWACARAGSSGNSHPGESVAHPDARGDRRERMECR